MGLSNRGVQAVESSPVEGRIHVPCIVGGFLLTELQGSPRNMMNFYDSGLPLLLNPHVFLRVSFVIIKGFNVDNPPPVSKR